MPLAPRPGFTKATVSAWRVSLEERGLGSSSIIIRMSAIRKLAADAADNGLLAPELAQGISRVKSVKSTGTRVGNWLSHRQAQTLLSAPDISSVRGVRDRAILAVLLGSGLRRSEAAALTFTHVQQRDGRWCTVDLVGRHGRVRTAPMPAWVKVAMDAWTMPAGLVAGHIFRPVNRAAATGERLGEKVVWQMLRRYAADAGMSGIAPHDLRRTCTKLCRAGELMPVFKRKYESGKIVWRYLFSGPGATRQERRLFAEVGFASKQDAIDAEAKRRIEELQKFALSALPAIDEKRSEQIRVFFRRELPLRLGQRDQSRNLSVPEPDTFGDLHCESGRERRTLRRQSADELEWRHSRLLRRRCEGLKVPPETGSSGLVPALTKSFQKRVEMLGEDSRSESFLALEVVIERAFWDVDGRGYVPNADVRVAKTPKQRGG
jgi:site-specific recombinase XerD